MTEPLFEATNVNFHYRKHRALGHINLRLETGRFVGLVGQNGSGKTTLLNLMNGLLLPTGGEVRTMGQLTNLLSGSVLEKIGMVHQQTDLPSWLTVEQHANFVAAHYSTWNWDLFQQLLDMLLLEKGAQIGNLSPGDRQKVSVACAVCIEPVLLILDEPFTYLDPLARIQLKRILFDMMGRHFHTVILCSHILSDIEKMADRLWMLHEGSLIVDEDMDDFQERHALWTMPTDQATLPAHFHEGFILRSTQRGSLLRLLVNDATKKAQFEQRYNVVVKEERVNLEQLYEVYARPLAMV